MAGNDDNPHTSAWMLLCDARAWVEALCKNRSTAERILLDHLDGVTVSYPRIRWMWRKIDLPLGRSGEAMNLVFFHHGKDARLDIDWDASGAVYFGPIPTLSTAPDDPKDRWPTFPKGIPPGRVEAYYIRLHRGDVLAVLRSLKILPPVSATEGGDTARVIATSASLPPGPRPDSRPSRPADALADLRKAYPQGDLSNRKYAHLLYPKLLAKSGNAWSLATLARRLSDKKKT